MMLQRCRLKDSVNRCSIKCLVTLLTTAGLAVFQVREDLEGHTAGRLEGHAGPHHVLLQAGHSQI